MKKVNKELERYIREERKNNVSYAEIFYELVKEINLIIYEIQIDEGLD